MKIKFFPNLMLIVCFSPILVGYGQSNEKVNNPQIIKNDASTKAKRVETLADSICKVCDINGNHNIGRDEFDSLIMNFDKMFVYTGVFETHGGVIVIEDDSKNLLRSFSKTYPTFKLHMGIDSNYLKRLFVTYEIESASCMGGKYTGQLGISSTLVYLTSDSSNDIKINKAVAGGYLSPLDIQNHFFTKKKKYPIKNDKRKEIDKAKAIASWNAFKSFDVNRKLYLCEDIMFNINLTLDEIIEFSKRNTFHYYFGYDDTKLYHKIRLILVGINKDDELVMFDATGSYLMRENSRPRP